MTDQAASVSKMETSVSQLRCIACGAVRANDAHNTRCAACGDLLEVVYPGWESETGMRAGGLDAAGLKALWRHRRSSPRLAKQNSRGRTRARRGACRVLKRCNLCRAYVLHAVVQS